MPSPIAVLRWIAVVPAAIGAWFAVLFTGAFVRDWAEAALCPPDEFRFGICYDSGWYATEKMLVAFFAGVSAVAVVLAAAGVAPSHRRVIAWTAFVVGTSIAIAMSSSSNARARAARCDKPS